MQLIQLSGSTWFKVGLVTRIVTVPCRLFVRMKHTERPGRRTATKGLGLKVDDDASHDQDR